MSTELTKIFPVSGETVDSASSNLAGEKPCRCDSGLTEISVN